MPHPPENPGRRAFLRGGLAAGTALGVGLASRRSPAGPAPRVRRYVPLGRTGLEVSDVSLGSSSLADPDVVRHAFDRGVNYFDTAESYLFGAAERAIGEALAPVRDRVHIATKAKMWPEDRWGDMMRALEGSLRRLRTDYVDVHFNHAVNDVARVRNPEWPEFVARAKRAGKIRFAGMSGHGGRLVPCLDHVLSHGLADVVLCAFNFGQDPAFVDRLRSTFSYVALQPDLPRALARARRLGVGVLAMKVLHGARLNDMRPYEGRGATFAQAAISWVQRSAYADATVISMDSRGDVDEYLAASGRAFAAATDLPLLERYAAAMRGRYCRPACDACEGACPAGVPIAEVLRTRMYDRDYGKPALARADYAALGAGAAACLACDGAPCRDACPDGLAIGRLTRDAARRLG